MGLANKVTNESIMNALIIDVREVDEFQSEYIEHSVNVPLSDFGQKIQGVLLENNPKSVVLLCKGGVRAQLALQQLQQLNKFKDISVSVYEGGLNRWKENGGESIKKKSFHFPIMRQVQIIVGLLVAVFSLLTLLVSDHFIWFPLGFGCALAFAGISGFCGLAKLLSVMPWNK